MVISYRAGKLTLAGTLTGGVIAVIIILGAGITGLAMLAAFFVLSILATAHKKKQKTLLTEAPHPEKRDAWQVLANGGVAGVIGVGMLVTLDMSYLADLMAVVMAAALASATADTLSSELGTVYGRKFYNITTLKPDKRGRDGVISLEGTLIGIVGSAVIAAVYATGFGWDIYCWFIIIAGTAGNLSDSLFGAWLERKGNIGNNAVNFINTSVAAFTALLLIVF
jgi:uncharacterized protein (TIGR00297 family)